MAAGRYRRTDPCTVDGCTKLISRTTLGLCEAHYYRLRRYGETGPGQLQRRGTPAPTCLGEGCERPGDRGHGYCDKHYQRLRQHGSPEVVLPQPTGPASPRWRGSDVTYSGAHQRVTKARGRADQHRCAMGCGRQAAQWSIVRSVGAPMPFSADPSDYRPLCVSCHKRYDMAALINEGWPHRVGLDQ